jgi:hypothetical protein
MGGIGLRRNKSVGESTFGGRESHLRRNLSLVCFVCPRKNSLERLWDVLLVSLAPSFHPLLELLGGTRSLAEQQQRRMFKVLFCNTLRRGEHPFNPIQHSNFPHSWASISDFVISGPGMSSDLQPPQPETASSTSNSQYRSDKRWAPSEDRITPKRSDNHPPLKSASSTVTWR